MKHWHGWTFCKPQSARELFRTLCWKIVAGDSATIEPTCCQRLLCLWTSRTEVGSEKTGAVRGALLHIAHRPAGVCLSPSGSASRERALHAVCAPRPQWAGACLSPSRPCGCNGACAMQCTGRNAGSRRDALPPFARHCTRACHERNCWRHLRVQYCTALQSERTEGHRASLRICMCPRARSTHSGVAKWHVSRNDLAITVLWVSSGQALCCKPCCSLVAFVCSGPTHGEFVGSGAACMGTAMRQRAPRICTRCVRMW